jgi:hypothetical protein
MVSIAKAAPDSFKMCRVAAMISGPMPSPWATVIGVGVAIDTKPSRISRQREAGFSRFAPEVIDYRWFLW